MGKEIFTRYDSVDYLETEEDIAAYLKAVAESGDNLALLARARNMSQRV